MKKISFISLCFVLPIALSAQFSLTSANSLLCNPVDPPSFEELDGDNDNFISKAEAGAFPCLDNSFNLYDTNGDNKISESEYSKLLDDVANGDLRCCDGQF